MIEAPSYSATELDVMRVGMALAWLYSFERLAAALMSMRPLADLSHPVGVGRAVKLELLRSRRTARYLHYGAFGAALAYAVDFAVGWALLYLSVLLVLEVTFWSSHGFVNHGHHLVTLVTLVQLAAVVVWGAAQRWDWDLGAWVGGSQQATMAWWSVQAIVAVYFTAGLTKLLRTDGTWIQRSSGLLLDAVARQQTRQDLLTNATPRASVVRSQRIVDILLERPDAARLLFAGGLLVELASPLGLLGAGALFVVGVSLLTLHQANEWVLGLPFPSWQLLVFVYLVNVPQLWT